MQYSAQLRIGLVLVSRWMLLHLEDIYNNMLPKIYMNPKWRVR